MKKDKVLSYLTDFVNGIKVQNQVTTKFGIELTIDPGAVGKIASEINNKFGNTEPNFGMAGSMVCLIAQLKPIQCESRSNEKYNKVNELAGIIIGWALCRDCLARASSTDKISIKPVMIEKWVNSLSCGDHSPGSCTLVFELLLHCG